MATLHIDDDLYRQLRADAEARGSSVEADVHRILEKHRPPPPGDGDGERRRAALLGMVSGFRTRPISPVEGYPGSVEFIRRMREEDEANLLGDTRVAE